jgi:hypothetical protein
MTGGGKGSVMDNLVCLRDRRHECGVQGEGCGAVQTSGAFVTQKNGTITLCPSHNNCNANRAAPIMYLHGC